MMHHRVEASRIDPSEKIIRPFGHTVYEGSDFRRAKDLFIMFSALGGVRIESRCE